MLTSSFTKSLAAGAAILGLAASLAWADAIEDRQAVMKQNGKNIGALAAIAKKEQPFDAAVVKENASAIAADLEKVKGMFPPGSEKGAKETYAKPEIWSDMAGFEAELKKAQDAALELAKVTDESQFGAALGALGNGCKGCHDKFRRPKDN